MTLHESQRAALAHFTAYARERSAQWQPILDNVLKMSNIARSEYDDAVASIKTHARVALHFHPDRPDPNLKTVAEALLACGIYKSQFETLLSNGSVSAFPGGERDLWEKQLFGGAYHGDGVTNGHRPKYGALDLMLHPDGPAPRFGSCYFLLKPSVSHRATFTYLDSHQNPDEKGTLEAFDDVMTGLLSESFLRDFAIGEKDLMPRRLVDHLRTELGKPFVDPSGRAVVRNLNHYIEAQVHGDVSLADDVDILVADPSFRGTATGDALAEICDRYGIEQYFHAGFALRVDEVPTDFRGATMPSLAARVASDGVVTVSMIGEAAMALKRDPAAWSDRGSYAEVLQELKLLWHVLVRYGLPLKDLTR